MARDDLLFELHKQTTQSPTDRNVSAVFGSMHAHALPGWPRHRENRENREFGSQFFQTGKTQGILL